ncbi:hypothetical protein [Lentilactobacillus sunkii]|uniref:Uncharacterized protein n=1 Tax=Lentilactobacillus sunkii DSM 19904 TaxID=1423808 RepID=A0A0R1L2S4_9LACO|nr:hypothetical protein [Lentilactobacillus sunkii]KRK87057.1 hypothetical protein FD17_GL001452 [Lentilactobacillus sunkii DSM 19904]
MQPILPNKTEFIPRPPANEHEIFMAMRTYPDNVKVYHPHGHIDATSVFWHNKLHPNALSFAVYVDPQATEQNVLFKRVLDDIEKLAWKFSDDRMITRDYAPQHPFNKWLSSRRFHLVNTELTAELPLANLSLGKISQPADGTLLSAGELSKQPDLYKSVLTTSQEEYDHQQTFNPAISIPQADWKVLMSHDQLQEAPFAILGDHHQIAAFSFLYKVDQQTAELGMMYGTNANSLNSLLNLQLQWLQGHYKTLNGTFQMHSKLDMKIFQSLPFVDVNKYETYVRLS